MPTPAAVRRNHALLAVYIESQIASELLTKTGFLMPDGTSKQGVGDIATTVNKDGDKIRALKAVPIKKAPDLTGHLLLCTCLIDLLQLPL